MSSLCRGHANLLCIVPVLVYVLPERALKAHLIKIDEGSMHNGAKNGLFSSKI